MGRQLESKLSNTIIKALIARGHYAYKNHGTVFSKKGLSDITGCRKDGMAIFLEVKRPGKESSGLDPAQRAFLSRLVIRTQGRAIVAVVSSVEQAIQVVEMLDALSVIEEDGFIRRRDADAVPVAGGGYVVDQRPYRQRMIEQQYGQQ